MPEMSTVEDSRHEVVVKVKFKGSKLAMGSSKMPSAVVDCAFMHRLTALNSSIVDGAAAVSVKKKKKSDDACLKEYGAPSIRRKANANGDTHNSSLADQLPKEETEKEYKDVHRDRSLGGLCLPSSVLPSTEHSKFFAQQLNRKNFQKLVEGIDPCDMDVTCDFDLWLWVEAQNLFAPMSYKTHDLSVLALKDIGEAALKKKWYKPSPEIDTVLSSDSAAAVKIETRGKSGAESNGRENDGNVVLDFYQDTGLLSPDPAPTALCPSGVKDLPPSVVYPYAHTFDVKNTLMFANTNVQIGAYRPPHAAGSLPLLLQRQPHEDTLTSGNNVNVSISNGTFPPMHAVSSSSSGGPPTSSRRGALVTAQGIDDAIVSSGTDPCARTADSSNGALVSSSVNIWPGSSMLESHHLRGATADEIGGGRSGVESSLEDAITEMEEELAQEHLRVNQLLYNLRKYGLQSPAARCELDEHQRQAERDRAVLARWRKTRTASNPINNRNNNVNVGSSSGGGIIAKAKSSHKKKLGTY